jgi:hypothetical protein
MDDPLNIINEMRQLDRKNREFYDQLSDEHKKKFSPFLMIRWGSSVEGSRELQEFYVIATNERLNKHFFAVSTSRHKKLQWLLATTVSPGIGTFRHTWIGAKKKNADLSKKKKAIADMYPLAKDDEIDLLAELITDKEIKQYIKDLGQE